MVEDGEAGMVGQSESPPPEDSPHWWLQLLAFAASLVVGCSMVAALIWYAIQSGTNYDERLSRTVSYAGGYLVVQFVVLRLAPPHLWDEERAVAVAALECRPEELLGFAEALRVDRERFPPRAGVGVTP